MASQEWIVPIKLKSSANISEHWMVKRKRNRAQEKAVWAAFAIKPAQIYPPCCLTLVRVAPRSLDEHDNLPYAFKHIVDYIGQILMPEKARGHADGSGKILVDYAQEKGQYAIKIKLEAL